MHAASHAFSTAARKGYYDPRLERDARGAGFVAQISGAPSQAIPETDLTALANVAHRRLVPARPATRGRECAVASLVTSLYNEQRDKRIAVQAVSVEYTTPQALAGIPIECSCHTHKVEARCQLTRGRIS